MNNHNIKLERGFYTNINGPTVDGDIDTDFSDIRKLQLLTDKLRRLCHILQLNINLGTQLKSCMQQIKDRTCAVSSSVSSFDSFNSQMDLFISQHRTHLARIESLVSRAQGVSGLVSSSSYRSTLLLIGIRIDTEHSRHPHCRK